MKLLTELLRLFLGMFAADNEAIEEEVSNGVTGHFNTLTGELDGIKDPTNPYYL